MCCLICIVRGLPNVFILCVDHIPPDWLTDGDNLLTVCESQGAPAPMQVSVVQKHTLPD